MRHIRFIERKSNQSILFKIISGFFLISELMAIVLVLSLSRIYSRYLRGLSVPPQVDLSGISTMINQQLRDGLIVATAIALLMTAVCYLFLRYQLKTMVEIIDMVSALVEGHRVKFVHTDRHEFGALAIALNQMVDRFNLLEKLQQESVELQHHHVQPLSDVLDRYVAHNSEGFMFVDAHHTISKINTNFAEILSISVDEAMGQDCTDILPSEVAALIVKRSPNQETVKLQVRFPYSTTYNINLVKVYDRHNSKASVHLPPNLVSDEPILLGTIIMAIPELQEQLDHSLNFQYRREISQKLRVPMTSLLSFVKLTKQKLEEVIFLKLVSPDEKTKRAMHQVSHNLDVMLVEGLQIAQSIGEVLRETDPLASGSHQQQGKHTTYKRLAVATFLGQVKLEIADLLAQTNTQLFFEENTKEVVLQTINPDMEADLHYVIKNLLSRLSRSAHFRKLVLYAQIIDARQPAKLANHHFPDQEPQDRVAIVVGSVNLQFSRSQTLSLIQNLKYPRTDVDPAISKGSGLTVIQSILDRYDGAILAETIDSHRERCPFYTLTLPIRVAAAALP
jgi:hypothetical protein